jgi:hypothetical protein
VKIPHRLRTVKCRQLQEEITSFAGLRFVFDLAARLGLIEELQRVTVKKRRRGIEVEDFVMSLAANFLVGGDSLSDLKVLRDECVTRRLCFDLQVPAPTTAGERLRSFSLGHLRQLSRANSLFIRAVDEQVGGEGAATVDLDSSIFEQHGYFREGARYGYTHVKGLHPLFAFWSERRLLLAVRLRSGNRSSAAGVESFLADSLRDFPAGRQVRLRMDAGFFAQKVEQVCVDYGLGFSVSAPMNEAIREEIEALSEPVWSPYPWEKDAEWAELSYQPTGWTRPYRLLVKRTAWYEGTQRVIGEFFCTAMLTNLSGAAPSLIRHHLARGGMENYIEEFKNGVGAAHLPSQRFLANWAWLLIAAIAYNLAQAFKLLLLPSGQHSAQLKHLRLHWFCVAARWIRTGRRWILAIPRGPDAIAAFSRTQRLLHTI